MSRRRFSPASISTKVGLAPGTSMFIFGPNGRHDVDDYRPEVHDSDGLLIANGRGERLWRPLANPDKLQISAFVDAGPRGFGLIQRNRDFESYQDVEAAYERRPSLWVEPVGDWGRGSVTLVEIPTEFRNPRQHRRLLGAARCRSRPARNIPSPIACSGAPSRRRLPAGVSVASTRSGRATIDGPSPVRLFVIDYAMAGPAPDAAIPAPTATVQASAGKIDHIVVLRNPATGGWRLTFDLDPEDAELIELRAVLDFPDGRACETWVYRWTIVTDIAGGGRIERRVRIRLRACRRRAPFRCPSSASTATTSGYRAALSPDRFAPLWPRIFVFGGTALMLGRRRLRDVQVLEVGGLTPIEVVLLFFHAQFRLDRACLHHRARRFRGSSEAQERSARRRRRSPAARPC